MAFIPRLEEYGGNDVVHIYVEKSRKMRNDGIFTLTILIYINKLINITQLRDYIH